MDQDNTSVEDILRILTLTVQTLYLRNVDRTGKIDDVESGLSMIFDKLNKMRR